MTIPKPIRCILYPIPGAVLAGGLIGLFHGRWGWPAFLFVLVALPPVGTVLSLPVDSLDLWLRRRTRDPVWLLTDEGRAWLMTADGQHWRARKDRGDAGDENENEGGS